MAGAEIQANMVHTLLSRRVGTAPHWGVNLALLIAASLAVSVLSLWLRPVWLALAALALVAVVATVSYELYGSAGTGSTSWRPSWRRSAMSTCPGSSPGGGCARRSVST